MLNICPSYSQCFKNLNTGNINYIFIAILNNVIKTIIIISVRFVLIRILAKKYTGEFNIIIC